MNRIEKNIPIQEYHSSEAISHSGIIKLLISPEHYLQWQKEGDEPTPAMEFGNAFHSYLLEPDAFNQRYVLAPKFDRRTKAGKEAATQWESENAGKIPLTADQMEAIIAMRESVMRHAGAAKMLEKGEAEISVFWTDRSTGIKCRARPDWVFDGGILDIKTCLSSGKAGFAKAAANLGYDIQAAFYVDAIREVTGKTVDFFFVAVEKNPPYSTACYKVSENMLEQGRVKYRAALELLRWCQENNEFPGYQPNGEIEEIDLPRWANFALEDDEV